MASSSRTHSLSYIVQEKKKYSWEEKSDEEGNRSKSLLIVCNRATEFFLYEVGISEDGLVEGKECDNLPLVCKLLDERGAMTVGCASLGSNLLLVSNGRHNLKTLTLNVENFSTHSKLHDYDTEKEKVHYPFLLVGAFGKIYAITTEYVGGNASYSDAFHSLDPITNRWETLPPPPFYSPSLRSVSGYAVLDQHDIILFCVGVPHVNFRMSFDFYSFNVCTREWKMVEMLELEGAKYKSEHKPYEHYCYLSVEDGKNYPFYGRAEVVDGVIYGYVFRTIVSYRFVVQEGDVFLEPRVFLHEARYPVTMQGCPPIAPFGDAPAFSKAPFGVPFTGSRRITYMGNNIFCVVETVEELPEMTDFQVVYINTFRLQGEVIEMLDSTIRLVAVSSTFGTKQANIMFCFAPFDLQLEWSRPPTTSLCANVKGYFLEKVPKFCDMFFRDSEDRVPMMLHARMLFSKWRCILQNSVDPAVQFFVKFMEFEIEDGQAPNLFQLVDKKLDKGYWFTPDSSLERLDNKRHVFVVLQSCLQECALYELEVQKTGIIGSSLLKPVDIIKPNQGASFGFGTFTRFDENLFLFSENKLPSEGSGTHFVIECCVYNMEKLTVVKQGASLLKAPKENVVILAKGSEFYALSSPMEFRTIPKPSFECFNPFSDLRETLEEAPFIPLSLTIVGYAYVGDHILISVCNGEFYSYHVYQRKWMEVIKLEGKDGVSYENLEGMAEYVDGIIYVFRHKVIGFVVEEREGHLFLHYPFELKGLDIVDPPLPWTEMPTFSMTHLGNKVFCAIITGGCSMSTQEQYACVTIFCVDGPRSVQTFHSTICVLDTQGLGTLYNTYCCTR